MSRIKLNKNVIYSIYDLTDEELNKLYTDINSIHFIGQTSEDGYLYFNGKEWVISKVWKPTESVKKFFCK